MKLSVQEAAARAASIQSELETYINPEKREYLLRFFKTGPGEYGEGDQFLGVVVPDTRRVAKRHKDAPLAVVDCLLKSPWHECRLCALLMLVEAFQESYAGRAEGNRLFSIWIIPTASITGTWWISVHLISWENSSRRH